MPMPMSTAEFAKRTVIVIALALVPVLVWHLFDVILIILGAVLVALLLRIVAEPLCNWLRLPSSIALIVAGLLIAAVIAGIFYLFGSQFGAQLQDVITRAKEAEKSIRQTLQTTGLGKVFLSGGLAGHVSIAEIAKTVLTVSAAFIGAVIVMIFSGIYLAFQPSLYREGLKGMFPPRLRAAGSEMVDSIGTALRRWLLGQLIQMVIIGVLSGIAVWLIGLPNPLALGLIAGLAEFVPYLGPIIAAIPAALEAITVGLGAFIWTMLAYVLIHQAEGHLFTPLIQRRMVYIPPAAMLFIIVAIDALFGPVALIFAAPIAVVLYAGVNKLYEINLREPPPYFVLGEKELPPPDAEAAPVLSPKDESWR